MSRPLMWRCQSCERLNRGRKAPCTGCGADNPTKAPSPVFDPRTYEPLLALDVVDRYPHVNKYEDVGVSDAFACAIMEYLFRVERKQWENDKKKDGASSESLNAMGNAELDICTYVAALEDIARKHGEELPPLSDAEWTWRTMAHEPVAAPANGGQTNG